MRVRVRVTTGVTKGPIDIKVFTPSSPAAPKNLKLNAHTHSFILPNTKADIYVANSEENVIL